MAQHALPWTRERTVADLEYAPAPECAVPGGPQPQLLQPPPPKPAVQHAGHAVPAEKRARFLTIGFANANQPGFDEGDGADLIGGAL